MSEWVQLTPEQSLEVGREAAYYINCVSSKWAHAIKVGELGSRVSFSTAELAAIPPVAALIEAARDASALLDEVAPDTALDTSGIADALDAALAALEDDDG